MGREKESSSCNNTLSQGGVDSYMECSQLMQNYHFCSREYACYLKEEQNT